MIHAAASKDINEVRLKDGSMELVNDCARIGSKRAIRLRRCRRSRSFCAMAARCKAPVLKIRHRHHAIEDNISWMKMAAASDGDGGQSSALPVKRSVPRSTMSALGQNSWESSHCFKTMFRFGTDHALPSANGAKEEKQPSQDRPRKEAVAAVKTVPRSEPGDQCFLKWHDLPVRNFHPHLYHITIPRGEQL